MQKHFQDWVEHDDNKATVTESNGDPDESSITHVAEIPMDEDQSYFASYAHFHIHHEMLSVSRNIVELIINRLKCRPVIHSSYFVSVGCGSNGELSRCHSDKSAVI